MDLENIMLSEVSQTVRYQGHKEQMHGYYLHAHLKLVVSAEE